MRYRSAGLLLALCLSSTNIVGQEIADLSMLHHQRAAQELESIINETTQIADKSAYVKVRARAANLLWLQDEERAKAIFIELWAWIEKQDESNFKKEDARTALLSNLFPRDSKLARKLLGARQTDDRGNSVNHKQVNKLTSELIESDPITAAQLLEQSIIANPSPANLPLLLRLREKDASLADSIATHLLEVIASQPTDLALSTIYSLNYYVFPATNAENGAAAVLNDSLRRQYFLSSYAILIRSVQEDRQPSQTGSVGNRDRSRSFFQGQIAELLAALSRQYAADHATQLQSLAIQLSTGMSSEFAQVAQAMLQRVNSSASLAGTNYDSDNHESSPEAEVISALAHNNFDEAKSVLDKVERASIRKSLSRMITTTEFNYHIAKENLTEALHIARDADDSDNRATMFAQIAKLAYKKLNAPFSPQILSESRSAIKKTDCTATKAMAVLSIASASASISAMDAVEWLRDGTKCFNSLDSTTAKEEKKNTENNLAKATVIQELQRAFLAVGKVDLDNALLVASMLEDSPVRLTAKLSACEKWVNILGNKSKNPQMKRESKGTPTPLANRN